MSGDPLVSLRSQITSIGDAVRWACVLEATAPKAGNVYPGRSFSNLNYADFIAAAEIAAEAFSMPGRHFSESVLGAVRQTKLAVGSNVNLGILLLIGPIAEVAHRDIHADLQAAVASLLEGQNEDDAACIFAAIRDANAGGLGEADELDVRDAATSGSDLIAAMRLAAHRDAVAYQYANGFKDLFGRIVPLVENAIQANGAILGGVADAHIDLLAQHPDTLIARKCGVEVAMAVQQRASKLDKSDSVALRDFDAYLRSDGNRLNPGTTADLIAAALFVLLVTSPPTKSGGEVAEKRRN
ncbi:triphosphoribosyl-dephospho-CoA protein [Rhodopirellula maiorica SM1]|uniref:Triphosphoribosyl-dephospho-CoA protein n=1 Tax=Rhodopirellula maiorica SM1 TaxID=1265738 RepID=M5RR39_9BACT|nr:triphosphoribosyl-dephospho-CoA synthase [Rhodopirellula maiorica]EMI21783.1 triphosphoribosyl-dephospho-CoA protein [Rhodopirellula maiorica SM1]